MANYELEEGQIVMCTVEKIIGTTVFVKIDERGEGTITTSEIAPGRIRNLRDYVIPGKKIVCKVLKIQGDKVHLSLRRVKQQERKELLDDISKEKSYRAILKTVLGEDQAIEVIKRISQEYSLQSFFEEIKKDEKLIEKYLDKEDSEKIIKILESKKEKLKEINQQFKLSSDSEKGVVKIKSILEESCKGSKCNISYLAAGKYRLSITGPDFKQIKSDVNYTIGNIEKLAKKENCEFSLEKE